MAVRLNKKNKFYMLIFGILIIGMILMLLWAVKKTNDKSTEKSFNLSNNSVVFSKNSNIVDTSLGGKIEKKWDGNYYFTGNDITSNLGTYGIVYEKATESLKVYGEIYKIYTDGSIVTSSGENKINDLNTPSFYKLEDREYLIISDEISTGDKTIFTNKFLRVSIDKQGNASLYNDVINVKTITPIIINFGEFVFDPANEILDRGGQKVDLKKVIGSTNMYTPPSTEAIEAYEEKVDFISKYNELVYDFTTYAKENNIIISDTTTVTNNYIVSNESQNQKTGKQAENKTKISKNVTLRGTIAYPTYIDISYLVTDPEDKYQVVYLIVEGIVDGEEVTKKIILDKYQTTYRLSGLQMKNEYTITLGDIEIVTDEETGKNSLVDQLEDVINVRTSSTHAFITINKIAKGRVYFNVKMSDEFAISEGNVKINAGITQVDSKPLDINACKSEKGYDTFLSLSDAQVFTLYIDDAYYGGEPISLNAQTKFTYSPAK